MNIDPLAEEFYEWTGYNYALNNPVNNIDPDGMFTLSGVAAPNFARQLQADLDKEEMRKLMSGEGDNSSGGGLKDWWKRVTKNWFKSDDDIALEDEYKDRRNKSKKGFWSTFYTNSGFRKGAEWFNNKLLDLTGGFGGLYIYGYGGGGTAGGRKDIEGKHNSIDFDDMLIPGGGGGKTAADLFEYLRFLSGGFTAGANAGSRFGSSDDVVNKKQNYTYETFDIGVPYLSDKYAVRKVTRDTTMRPADHNNTNWEAKSLYDSVRKVREAKRLNSGRPTIYFNGNGYQILE